MLPRRLPTFPFLFLGGRDVFDFFEFLGLCPGGRKEEKVGWK